VNSVRLARVGLRPDKAVAGIVRDIEAIHYRHASGEFAGSFDFNIVLARAATEFGVDGDRHGYWIGERDAAFAGLCEVSVLSDGIAADGEFRERRFEGDNFVDVFEAEGGFAATEMPAYHFDVHARVEDNACGFGVDPNVEFGGGRDVAFAAGIAAHDDAAVYGLREVWFARQGEREVGERAKCDDFDSRISADGLEDGVRSVR